MNSFWELMDHPLAHRVGWVLLHSLWQGALIAAAFGLARLAMRRRSANARYLAGCLGLALMLAAPAATLLFSQTPRPEAGRTALGAADQPRVGVLFPIILSSGEAGGIGGSPAASKMSWLIQEGAELFGRLAPSLAALWLAGVAFFSARLTRSCWSVKQMRSCENELLDPAWLETLNDLRCRLEISQPVRLLKSALVEVPTVIGWLRPVILLPASCITGLTPSQLEAILAHELAHVRRFDYLVNAGQCVVETLMFYHPVVWWFSRCIREERENCCDDLVVKVCGNRLAYARALATLEESRADLPQLAFAATGGSLLKRIRRLLRAADENAPITAREVAGLALLGIGLALIVMGVCLNLAPTAYSATARLKIEPDAAARFGPNGVPSAGGYDPYYIQTEFEVIQSEAVLSKAVKELNLNTEWGKRYAGGKQLITPGTIALLRGRLDLRPIRNTSFIEIRVFSEQPEDAARVANAVARAYQAFRKEQHEHLAQGGIDAMQKRLSDQEGKVAKAQQEVEKLREDFKIPDGVATETAPSGIMSPEARRRIEGLHIENQAEFVKQSTLLRKLKNLAPEELPQVLPTAVSDALLSSLLEQSALTEQALVVRVKEYGTKHFEVIKLKTQVEDLQNKISRRVAGILTAMEAKVASLQESQKNLEEEVDKATAIESENAKRWRPYFDKKRELEELQRFRQILTMKIASEQIDQKLPKSALVEIMDAAAPPLRPAAPNRPRATALIVLGVLLDLAGWLLVRRRPLPNPLA